MSKVYMVNMRTIYGNSMLKKVEDLVRKSGLLDYDLKGKFIALKIHFGEYGNLAYIKPQYIKVIGDLLKEQGAIPFLVDCSTLYSGSRSDAISHLKTAALNGWSYSVTGMENIIGDGLKGNDEKIVPIHLKHCATAKIGTSVMDADFILSLNHFKGHEQAGFGGAIKNIGMGCGSKLGKLEMHSGSKPSIQMNECISCTKCTKHCNQHAIHMEEKAVIDYDKCVGCGECIVVCPVKAIHQASSEISKILNEKIAEYTYAVLKEKEHFHINFITSVSPNCDCWGSNDTPIVPDIGILASSDPIAIDKASANLVNEAYALHNTVLTETEHTHGEDKFSCIHKNVDWMSGLIYAEELNLGTQEYELIKLDKEN